MINMIKLDWLSMKFYWFRIIILPIMVIIYGLLSEAIIIPLISFIMLSFSVNPFAVEEKGKLDNLYLTLPITRIDIVKTRYSLSLIMQLSGIIFGVIVTILMSSILKDTSIFFERTFTCDFKTIWLLICGSLLFYSIINLSMFPTLFKIGYAKGKAIGFYIPLAGVTVVIMGVYFAWFLSEGFQEWLINTIDWIYSNPILISGILLISSVLILYLSYSLSCKFYSNRDL